MVDKWHAECVPCKWLTLHDDQQLAIDAAVEHVVHIHPDLSAEHRGREYIGHVQFRTVGAVAHPKDAPKPAPHPEFRQSPGDGAANTPAVMEQQPEAVEAAGGEEQHNGA